MIGFVLLLLLLTSCGKPIGDPNYKFGIDPAFESYVQEYEELYGVQILHIPMHFRDLDNDWIGACYKALGDINEIFIDPDYWDNSTERGKTAVIFHELEHCFKNEDHRNFLLSDNCPGSLMNAYQPSQACLVRHWNYYVEELR